MGSLPWTITPPMEAGTDATTRRPLLEGDEGDSELILPPAPAGPRSAILPRASRGGEEAEGRSLLQARAFEHDEEEDSKREPLEAPSSEEDESGGLVAAAAPYSPPESQAVLSTRVAVEEERCRTELPTADEEYSDALGNDDLDDLDGAFPSNPSSEAAAGAAAGRASWRGSSSGSARSVLWAASGLRVGTSASASNAAPAPAVAAAAGVGVAGGDAEEERHCFICLGDADKDTGPLVSCCSTCYACTHMRCWRDWRNNQRLTALRSRLLGLRMQTNHLLRCSICKSGTAVIAGEEDGLQWMNDLLCGNGESQGTDALAERLAASMNRGDSDEDNDAQLEDLVDMRTCVALMVYVVVLVVVLLVACMLIVAQRFYAGDVVLCCIIALYELSVLQIVALAVARRRSSAVAAAAAAASLSGALAGDDVGGAAELEEGHARELHIELQPMPS